MITVGMIVVWSVLGLLGVALLVDAARTEDCQWLEDREEDTEE